MEVSGIVSWSSDAKRLPFFVPIAFDLVTFLILFAHVVSERGPISECHGRLLVQYVHLNKKM